MKTDTYILTYRPHFKLGDFIYHPFKAARALIVQSVIRLFSQSNFHHIAHCYMDDDGVWRVSEAKYPKYRIVDLFESFYTSHCKVMAYRIQLPVNRKRLLDFQKEMLGRDYDAKGAQFSEVHEIPILKELYEKSDNDQEIFCSESIILLLMRLKMILKVKNKNHFSPQEVFEMMLEKNIIYKNDRAQIWDGDNINCEYLSR